jgi:glycerol-3-phosphate dehydrogenase
MQNDKTLSDQIHPSLPFIKAEIIWTVRDEMCMQVEDFLARRTRALLLDAKASMECAPVVAEIMAKEMQKDILWVQEQITSFNSIAKNYLPG